MNANDRRRSTMLVKCRLATVLWNVWNVVNHVFYLYKRVDHYVQHYHGMLVVAAFAYLPLRIEQQHYEDKSNDIN